MAPLVLVTHHVEEIPPAAPTACSSGGRVVAAGPLDDVLTADALSALYGVDLALDHRDGRYAARAVTPAR